VLAAALITYIMLYPNIPIKKWLVPTLLTHYLLQPLSQHVQNALAKKSPSLKSSRITAPSKPTSGLVESLVDRGVPVLLQKHQNINAT